MDAFLRTARQVLAKLIQCLEI